MSTRLVAWARLHPSVLVTAALVFLWALVGAGLAIWYSGRIQDWSVMTDELLYAKLATAIATSGSPFPEVHGTSIAVYNQLYPLLIAPLYGALTSPEAFRAVHVLNAFVMASAVFPVYLLGRQILPRAWAFAVAGLSILVPWMVLTGFLMTEAAAYPAFVWAVLGLQRAIAAPSPRRDLLAVGALGFAILARTQFAVLVLVLPLAIVGHELGTRRNLREGLRAAIGTHRVLAAIYATGVALAAVLAVAGSFGRLLGVYAVTVEGSLLPSGVWAAAARHLDAVALGCGLVPLILGGGWIVATVVRARSRPKHALATLSLVIVTLLTFEAASFSVRFGDSVVRDRYLFYVVPLLLIGSAAALRSAHRWHVAAGAGVVTMLFALTAAQLPFTVYPGVWVDSPASVLNEVLIEQSGGLGTGTFVALLGLFTGLVLVLALLLSPRIPFAILTLVAVLTFSILTLRSEVDRIVEGTGLSGRPLAGPPGLVLDWVDTVVPNGESAALVAFPVSTAWDTTAIRWWDLELWNRSVTRAVVGQDGNFAYTPFPDEKLRFNRRTGEVLSDHESLDYVVTAPRDPRFQLAGSKVAENVGLVIRSVSRPYRLVWSTRVLEPDGWTRPGEAAWVEVYGSGKKRVRVTLRAPDEEGARYLIEGDQRHVGALEAGTERAAVVTVCAPAQVLVYGNSDARVPAVQLSPTVAGTRNVGVLVGPISVDRLREPC